MTNKTTHFVLQNVTNKPDWLVKPLLYHFKPVYQSAVHNILVIHKATTVQAAKAAGMTDALLIIHVN